MAGAFTPGPWESIVDKTGEVTVYEATTLANIDICKMGGNTNDGSNARLIAAAPDLLEALQHLVTMLQAGGYGTAHADAAIAKATGAAA
jgi:hypothetical protein